MRIPPEWHALAQEIADTVGRLSPGSIAKTSKTEILRAAIGIGLVTLSKGYVSSAYGKTTVTALTKHWRSAQLGIVK